MLVVDRVAFAFGVTTTFCLWWMYFNDFKAQMLRQTAQVSHLWLYGHLPLHLFHALLGMLMATTLEYTEGEPLPSPLPELALGTAALVFFSSGFLTYVNSVEDRGACTPLPTLLRWCVGTDHISIARAQTPWTARPACRAWRWVCCSFAWWPFRPSPSPRSRCSPRS